MNKHIYILLLSFCFLMIGTQSFGQFNTDAAKQELQKRGLTEQEVKDALMAKGIDVDNINTNDPVELAKYESTIRETIAELEKLKKESNTPKKKQEALVLKENTKSAIKDEKVIEAIEGGATVEEAISEEIQEKQKEILPPTDIYGHQIFKNNSLKLFRTTEGAKVPNTYKLGPGDVINIAIWGDSERELNQEITKDGYIKPDGQSRIFLSGLTIEQAKTVIYRSFRKFTYFNQSQIAVTVITARTINVNIVGDVFNPGSYNISAINTGVNALVAAGGPNEIGSVRNIKLMSPGNDEKTIDLYQYLLNPIVNEGFYLSENDYIFVPVAEKIVEIKGAVNRPYKYELKMNENLKNLIDFSGGLKATAVKNRIQVMRIENDKNIAIDVDYSQANNKNFALKNGDVITVNSINNSVDNIVEIQGAVENEGEYEFREGMRIKDVLDKAILNRDAIKEMVYIRRLNPDLKTRRYEIINIEEALKNPSSESNIKLERGDIIIISASSTYVDNFSVEIEGEVRKPGTFNLDINDDLRVSDLIFLAGGLTEKVNDFGYIFRTDIENNNKKEYIYVNLLNALKQYDSSDNYVLKPGDELKIYSLNEYLDESDISIEGAVRKPTKIPYSSKLTLRDAILISGGLKMEASKSRVEIFRVAFEGDNKTKTLVASVSIDGAENFEKSASFKLMPFDQIVVRKAPAFELQQNVTIEGEVTYPGRYALLSDNTRLSDIVKQSGNLTKAAFLGGATLKRNYNDIGYIIINLEEAIKSPNSTTNVILIEGDELYIPKRKTLVSISGATNAALYYPESMLEGKINVNYDGNKNAYTYLKKYAGGVADNGDKKSIVVEYPNGQVKKTRQILFFNIYPKVKEGSHIKVSAEVEKTKEEKDKEEIDWGKVLSNSITQAVSILSLVLLLRSLD